MSSAIVVEGVSKSYTIRHEARDRYVALRDVIAQRVKSAFHRSEESGSAPASEDFWALKDVSFEVSAGERLGIIGRNGAGKSTLLKILSRITDPTEGRIRIVGRVASLLEVGTGFHPELTGRENIFLNGVILGMTRSEVRKRFDEIVAFAEIEKFLDTPVKRYSSGMYVRLAFAVAAHLETEIMIVDEVLAVGDSAFQEKCLAKMEDVATGGRTVLFVSHNMAAVKHLCTRAALLDRGTLAYVGETAETTDEYERRNRIAVGNPAARWERSGSGRLRVDHVNVCDAANAGSHKIPFNGSARITVKGAAGHWKLRFAFAFQVVTASGLPVLFGFDQFQEFEMREGERFELRVITPSLRLVPDVYFVNVWLGTTGVEDLDYVRFAASFEMTHTTEIRATIPLNHTHGLSICDAVVERVL